MIFTAIMMITFLMIQTMILENRKIVQKKTKHGEADCIKSVLFALKEISFSLLFFNKLLRLQSETN